jgi:hypothetical protein
MITRVAQFSLVMGVIQKYDADVEYERKYIECEERGKFSLGKEVLMLSFTDFIRLC